MARTSLGWSTPTILLLLSPLPILANSLSHGQIPLYDSASPIDISGAKFQGLNTYANLPYVHCLSNGEVEEYDIAILGAPFDTVSPPDSLQGMSFVGCCGLMKGAGGSQLQADPARALDQQASDGDRRGFRMDIAFTQARKPSVH